MKTERNKLIKREKEIQNYYQSMIAYYRQSNLDFPQLLSRLLNDYSHQYQKNNKTTSIWVNHSNEVVKNIKLILDGSYSVAPMSNLIFNVVDYLEKCNKTNYLKHIDDGLKCLLSAFFAYSGDNILLSSELKTNLNYQEKCLPPFDNWFDDIYSNIPKLSKIEIPDSFFTFSRWPGLLNTGVNLALTTLYPFLNPDHKEQLDHLIIEKIIKKDQPDFIIKICQKNNKYFSKDSKLKIAKTAINEECYDLINLFHEQIEQQLDIKSLINDILNAIESAYYKKDEKDISTNINKLYLLYNLVPDSMMDKVVSILEKIMETVNSNKLLFLLNAYKNQLNLFNGKTLYESLLRNLECSKTASNACNLIIAFKPLIISGINHDKEGVNDFLNRLGETINMSGTELNYTCQLFLQYEDLLPTDLRMKFIDKLKLSADLKDIHQKFLPTKILLLSHTLKDQTFVNYILDRIIHTPIEDSEKYPIFTIFEEAAKRIPSSYHAKIIDILLNNIEKLSINSDKAAKALAAYKDELSNNDILRLNKAFKKILSFSTNSSLKSNVYNLKLGFDINSLYPMSMIASLLTLVNHDNYQKGIDALLHKLKDGRGTNTYGIYQTDIAYRVLQEIISKANAVQLFYLNDRLSKHCDQFYFHRDKALMACLQQKQNETAHERLARFTLESSTPFPNDVINRMMVCYKN